MKFSIHTPRILLFLFIFIATGDQSIFAQEQKKKGVNLSLNIGSATSNDTRTVHFNFGLLSHIDQLKGLGINGLFNSITSNAYGVQVSGISNINGNEMKGFQAAGITNINRNNSAGVTLSALVNINGQRFNGVSLSAGVNIIGINSNGLAVGGLLNTVAKKAVGMQISGLANIIGEKSQGVALSGLINVCGKDLRGVQLSSLLNITGENAKGVQLSALGNVSVKVNGLQLSALNNTAAEELKGLQFSALSNVAKKVSGAQIGTFNYSMGEVKGVQLGIINYSKDTSTVKIGLINLSPKTRIQLLAFGGNTTKANLAVRFQNKITYTMLGGGAQYLGLNEKLSITSFYRAGLHFPVFKQLEISGDLGYAHIENLKNKSGNSIPYRMYSLQARINLEYHPIKSFGVFASGGYAFTRHYNQNKTFEQKPIIELGIVLF